MAQTPAPAPAAEPPARPRPPAVELVAITKRFPGVVANDRVTFAVEPGEVHCLLGENGAGKSTLMSILAGMLAPDEGTVRVEGEDVRIDSPRRALELGIGMVYQHSTLVPALTVLENLMLGESRALRLPAADARARLEELAGTLGVEVDPEAEAGRLALGQQQQIEIVKALWRGSKVLILDEPTSMLTPQGVEELQKVLLRLKEAGLAIVFITHKLHEALAIGDRISILKQGRLIATLERDVLRGRPHDELQAEIVRIMFGEEARAAGELAELQDELAPQRAERELAAEAVLEVEGLSVEGDAPGHGAWDVTLSVRAGEILGVAGVDGNGQRELAEAIAGQRPIAAGDVRLHGRSLRKLSVYERQRLGLRYVTDDRLGEGTVGGLSVSLNIVLKRIGRRPFWRRGRIQHRVVDREARELVERFEVKTPGVLARIATLSGGNVQKVVLARELSFDPKLVVYNKPTHGLDVRTTRAVRERIREQADRGVAAMVISTDLDELIDLCDRIAVMYRGRIGGVVENDAGAASRIGELIIGGGRPASTPPPHAHGVTP
jgi:general nucleoside transport system ATP-binding protein